MKTEKQVWHYTAATKLMQIITSGEIKPGTILLEKNERPSVWVSANPVWENTATKMARKGSVIKQLTFEEMKTHFGLARIEVKFDDSLVPWSKFKRASRISSTLYHNLERAGYEMRAKPHEWYAVFHSIKMENWISIEVWQNNSWVKYKNYVEA